MAKIEEELQKLKSNWPFLVLVSHDSHFQILLVGEREVITEVKTLWEGLKSLLGTFFCI